MVDPATHELIKFDGLLLAMLFGLVEAVVLEIFSIGGDQLKCGLLFGPVVCTVRHLIDCLVFVLVAKVLSLEPVLARMHLSGRHHDEPFAVRFLPLAHSHIGTLLPLGLTCRRLLSAGQKGARLPVVRKLLMEARVGELMMFGIIHLKVLDLLFELLDIGVLLCMLL